MMSVLLMLKMHIFPTASSGATLQKKKKNYLFQCWCKIFWYGLIGRENTCLQQGISLGNLPGKNVIMILDVNSSTRCASILLNLQIVSLRSLYRCNGEDISNINNSITCFRPLLWPKLIRIRTIQWDLPKLVQIILYRII